MTPETALSVIEGNCAHLFDIVGEAYAWQQREAFTTLKNYIADFKEALREAEAYIPMQSGTCPPEDEEIRRVRSIVCALLN